MQMPIPASLFIGGIALYYAVMGGLAYVLIAQPLWNKAGFIVAILAPHFVAMYWIRRPAPWTHRTREELVFVLTVFFAIPACSLVFLTLLGLSIRTELSAISGATELVMACTLPFMLCSAGTAMIANGLKKKRSMYYDCRCRRCLYDLTSVESDTCPECNTHITRPAEAAS